MTGREKYEIYTTMMMQAEILERAIRRYYEEREYTIYSVFLAVQNEEERTYFVDIEVGGSAEKNCRIRGEERCEGVRKKYMAEKKAG